MSDPTSEKRLEEDISTYLLSDKGGYTHNNDVYDPEYGIFTDTLLRFVQATQPREWKWFITQNKLNPEKKFVLAFNDAANQYGLIHVLRHGFKHNGRVFRVCYFKPESTLNQTAGALYAQNEITCGRQWFYSNKSHNSVDMVIAVNGIPVFAFELKNQYTGQNVDNAKRQWMYDRDQNEACFRFNRRVLAFFCVDHTEVWMTTKLAGKDTYFLPFNQGSAGAGRDGGKGNPPNENGYPTSYLWEKVFVKDSMMDIIQKFIQLQTNKTTGKQTLIFPRYHQLDVVRKLITDVSKNGAGVNYLIQHSAGSGKSNSIAWLVYRLASLHNTQNAPVFRSVIVVTDRTVLDAQLQDTISDFDATIGTVAAISEDKTSRDLLDAINKGSRIIISTLQKFPYIYKEINQTGYNYAIVVDEAHSSQTGSAALSLKAGLGDMEEALREYAELEGLDEAQLDIKNDKLLEQLVAQGKHSNLSFFAFTATPKDKTLQIFGTEYEDGSFHPFHIYSMKQAIEEGFILDVLLNYMTYGTYYKIIKDIPENPDLPASQTAKLIRKFEELHPYNISQKSQIIVETFRNTTSHAIGGRGKMMVVTASRLAAVRYFHEVKKYIEGHQYPSINVMIAFSGVVKDGDIEYTEAGMNTRADGTHISEDQTKQEFHDHGQILIVAEKFQTGFDEPLLHTMIVDKKLRGVKTVQTLSRLNRTCPGKMDTFILDYINTVDDIKAEFEPFYHETTLSESIKTDLIYQTQQQLRDYHIYDQTDIDRFMDVWTKLDTEKDGQGKMTSALKPVVNRYNAKKPDERYLFRRQLRSFCRWYSYIAQIFRMFDKETHAEFLFGSYLLNLIPPDSVEPIDLDGKLQLEFYRLEETFKGSIVLDDGTGVYTPPENTSAMGQEEKEPLEEIIEKINEKYATDFTEEDRVLLTSLLNALSADDKLTAKAAQSDERIFMESIFPKVFGKTALESYKKSEATYRTLFEDKSKYNAYMTVLAQAIYRAFHPTIQ